MSRRADAVEPQVGPQAAAALDRVTLALRTEAEGAVHQDPVAPWLFNAEMSRPLVRAWGRGGGEAQAVRNAMEGARRLGVSSTDDLKVWVSSVTNAPPPETWAPLPDHVRNLSSATSRPRDPSTRTGRGRRGKMPNLPRGTGGRCLDRMARVPAQDAHRLRGAPPRCPAWTRRVPDLQARGPGT